VKNQEHLHQIKVILAFSAVYIFWGSSFYGVMIGLKSFPPFLFSALRFMIAGMSLLVFCILKKEPFPAFVFVVDKNPSACHCQHLFLHQSCCRRPLRLGFCRRKHIVFANCRVVHYFVRGVFCEYSQISRGDVTPSVSNRIIGSKANF
jgi:hypothetical protein